MVKVGLGLWVHWRCCSDNSLPTHIIRLTPFKALPFHNHCCVQAKPRRDGSRQWPSNPASLGYLGLNHTSFPFAIPYERLLNDLFSFFELLTKGMATPAHPGTIGFMRYWKLEIKAQTLDSGSPPFNSDVLDYFCVTFSHADWSLRISFYMLCKARPMIPPSRAVRIPLGSAAMCLMLSKA